MTVKKWISYIVLCALSTATVSAKMPKLMQSGWLKVDLIGQSLIHDDSEITEPYLKFDMEDYWALSGLEVLTWQWQNSFVIKKNNSNEDLTVGNLAINDIVNSGVLFLALTNSIDIGVGYVFAQPSISEVQSATLRPKVTVMMRW